MHSTEQKKYRYTELYNNKERPFEGMEYEDLLDLLSLTKDRCEDVYYYREQINWIRKQAYRELLAVHSSPTLANNLLQQGCQVVIVGQSSFKYKEIKPRLARLGISTSIRIKPNETTHILLGLNPKKLKGLDEHQLTLMTDIMFQAELNRLEQPYLIQKEEPTTASHEGLEALLMSRDDNNKMIALQMMDGGGMPQKLIEATFYAAVATSDKAIKKIARKLLNRHVDTKLRMTLSLAWHLSESNLYKKLIKYHRYNPTLDIGRLAALLYQYRGIGYEYIFSKKCTNTALVKKVLDSKIQGTVLNLASLGISRLPSLLATRQEVTKVILFDNHFKSIPRVLSKLKKLKHIDMGYNALNGLNSSLRHFQQITYLNLRGNYIGSSIDYLSEIQQLEELTISPTVNWLNQSEYLLKLTYLLPNTKVVEQN